MTPPALIGLLGKKRAGKDTAARFLAQDHGFVRYAFADPLKSVALYVDPFVSDGWHYSRLSEVLHARGEHGAKELAEVRQVWQRLGVAMREHVDPDVWLDATMRKVLAESRPVVITDVRFPNEADAIEAAGGLLVRILRALAPTDDAHVSETALDSRACGAHIVNDGPVESLRAAVWHLVGP